MEGENKAEGKTVFIGETKQIDLEQRIYHVLPNFDPVLYSFGCPIEHEVCGELENIQEYISPNNVFIAIPYSDYDYEKDIVKIIVNADLMPIMAKDKILSKILLCKVCRELRKCKYGIVDISSSNINVIYELGLMQSLGNKCAILFKAGSDRPTDLQGIENVYYVDKNELLEKLSQWLKDNVQEVNQEKLDEYLSSS